MGTSGLVPAWCPFSDKEKMVYRGLAAKVFNTLKAQMPHVQEDAMDWVPIEPEKLKQVYDDLVTESGAHILFLTALADVDRDDQGNITTLLLLNKGGLQAFRAAVYVDCTGDGDVAAWAGAEYQMGDEETGELQPATHCFILGNVDEYAYLNGPKLHADNPHSPIHEVVRSGEYPGIPDTHLCNNMVAPRAVGFNAGHLWGVDNTNPFSVSGALVEGRKMAAAYRDMLAAVHPAAFGNAVVMSTGTLIGTRESRRITGDYVLTAEDYISRRSFSDEICRNSYFIDVHGTQKEQQSGMDQAWPSRSTGRANRTAFRTAALRRADSATFWSPGVPSPATAECWAVSGSCRSAWRWAKPPGWLRLWLPLRTAATYMPLMSLIFALGCGKRAAICRTTKLKLQGREWNESICRYPQDR